MTPYIYSDDALFAWDWWCFLGHRFVMVAHGDPRRAGRQDLS